MKIINFLFIMLSLACAGDGWQDLAAADTAGNRFQVVYQRSISTASDVEGEPGFFSKAFNLIVGAHEKRIQRPFCLWAGPGGKLLLSDQLQQTLISIDTTEHRFNILNRLQSPSIAGILQLPDGRILLSDSKLNAIYWIDPDANQVKPFAVNTKLIRPTALVFNHKSQEIWVTETGAHRVSIFTLDGTYKKSIGKRGTENAAFNFPTFLWADKNGTVYVVDAMNFRVQRFDQQGNFLSAFGQAGGGTGYFARPRGIATDSYGHVYVVDALFHSVQVFDVHGRFLDYFGGQGREGGQFWLPAGIFIDSNNTIYVADSYNKRIQIFKLIRRD